MYMYHQYCSNLCIIFSNTDSQSTVGYSESDTSGEYDIEASIAAEYGNTAENMGNNRYLMRLSA